MPHAWIPNSSPSIKERMLREIGVRDIMELFNDVPQHLILSKTPDVGFGRPLTEIEVRRKYSELMGKNILPDPSKMFLGGGVCIHYIPAAVKAIVSRSEFLTAYTPYQAEIAQGLLQAFFEYQSLLAELYGIDIVNASLYNGSTAAAEAVRMVRRVRRGRRKVLVAGSIHPETLEVIKTWVMGTDIGVKVVPFDPERGVVTQESFEKELSNDVAGVYLESPNFFGAVEEDMPAIIEATHKHGGLAIVGSTPISLGVLEPPGEIGADIVVGDAQPLGLGLNYGGPSAGIFGIKDEKELVKQLPGRLIGATVTADGSDLGFMMILQTREQHIRRERATSNITTNSGLEAIAAAVYLSLLGSEGITKLGKEILGRTYYLLRRLQEMDGVEAPAFTHEAYFREIPISFGGRNAEKVLNGLRRQGIYAGPPLSRFFQGMADKCLVCVTEVHSRRDIDEFAEAIAKSLGGGE
ncbi:MAG: aminomethyl-transferring glycine dehydrogenase subunit GcvPA [Thermoprotei archaeon]|nr:MAG: aminomethyl-transferring glycine dehydrogenase subunit GcvPA [Thermoprotei archaeon]